MPEAVPYIVRPFVADRYEPRGRLGDYMRADGRDVADALRYQGAMRAKMLSEIGQGVSGTLQDIAQYPEVIRQRQMAALKLQEEQDAAARARWKFAQEQKAAAQQEADQDKLNGLLQEYGGRPPADRIVREFGPLRGTQVNKWLDDNFGSPKDAAKRGADIVKDMGGYGPLSENAVDDVMQSPDAGRVRYSFGPGMANGPEVLPNRPQQEQIDLKKKVEGMGGLMESNGTIKFPPKDKPQTMRVMPAMVKGQRAFVRVDDQGNMTDMSGRPVQADPMPPASSLNSDQRVALSPEAVQEAAHRVLLYGPSSIPTRFDDNDKKTILNASAELNKSLGKSPAWAAMRAAVQKSDQAALTQITKAAASASAFENKATAQADLVNELSQKVSRTDYPIINGALVSGKAALGNTPAHLLGNALLTFTNEYAKIMEGSTGSAAGSTDAARRSAAELISKALSKGTLAATIDQMKREMRMTIDGYRVVSDDIQSRMGGGAAPSSAPKVEVWDFDAKGNLVKKGGQ